MGTTWTLPEIKSYLSSIYKNLMIISMNIPDYRGTCLKDFSHCEIFLHKADSKATSIHKNIEYIIVEYVLQ